MAKQTIISKEIPIKKNQTQGFKKALLLFKIYSFTIRIYKSLFLTTKSSKMYNQNRITNIPSDTLRKKDPSFKLLFYTVFYGNRCIHKPIIDLKKQMT